MEMERINENTIRVLIGSEDLAARGITFLDLLGNHKQIENFFYSILEEVDVEEQFQETDAITFQVLPNRDGLELFISKNLNMADAMDFDGMRDDRDMQEFTDMIRKQAFEVEDHDEDEIDSDDIRDVVIQVNDFENVVSLAKEVFLQNALSNLYRMDGSYYLQVVFYTEQMTDEQIDNDIAQLLEYGNSTQVTIDVLAEDGDLLMERSALELTRYYFK